MDTKTVVVGGDIYKLTAVPCDISGAISIELISNLAPLIVAFVDGNTQLLNTELRQSVNSEKLMRIFQELINVNVLFKNEQLVKDWREEFQRKPMTFFQLGVEALRFNCEDFFTFMSGFASEKNLGKNLQGVIKSLKEEGVEIPPAFSFLFQNGEQTEETNPSQK